MVPMPFRIVVEENRNFIILTEDNQPMCVNQDLKDAPIIFTLHDYIFQCSLITLVKMIKLTVRKSKYNEDQLDEAYRKIVRKDPYFKHIRCRNLDFFENFDKHFRSIDGPRTLDIEIPYYYRLIQKNDKSLIIKNILTNQVHHIDEFQNISSCGVCGSPRTGYTDIRISRSLLFWMFVYHETYSLCQKLKTKRDNSPEDEEEYQDKMESFIFNTKKLKFAIKDCKLFNFSTNYQIQISRYDNDDSFENLYIYCKGLDYFNHLDEINRIMIDYQP